ncbi:helix-turn-helix domain-containing protein [Cupriavidus necator]|uniref:helix-turn-helix domain-containing protein n=1 Tax=Cupriavidus necator TaxID=106590 RepID=UPI0005B390FB|nr:LysR family transcriptional regulator [Cupriavidus necator]
MAFHLNNRRVSFLSLRAFIALMQHRDTTRAARALGIQSQRLLYQIRSLEAALGTPLFRVGSPAWLPTPIGVNALPKVIAMLAIWEQLEPGTCARQHDTGAAPAVDDSGRDGLAFWVRQSTM